MSTENAHASEAQQLIASYYTSPVGYETADAQHITLHLEALTKATLAVAYEQRTANLIALWAMPEELASSLASASGVGNDGVQKDIYAGVAQQILGRLGL